MNLTELAIATFHEYAAQSEEGAGEEFEKSRDEFLDAARRCAKDVLCADAEKLDWQYTPGENLPEQVEEATALLEPRSTEYLRYRVDHGTETVDLKLVQPCDACGCSRINPVQNLVALGALLSGGGDDR